MSEHNNKTKSNAGVRKMAEDTSNMEGVSYEGSHIGGLGEIYNNFKSS
jgi:hypothetical protein